MAHLWMTLPPPKPLDAGVSARSVKDAIKDAIKTVMNKDDIVFALEVVAQEFHQDYVLCEDEHESMIYLKIEQALERLAVELKGAT